MILSLSNESALRLNRRMQNLVMIPALGCDGGLYADILPRLSGVVEPVTIVADKDTLTGCVQQVLEQAPEKFIILGTSFGGRTALEVAFAAPDRVQGLVVIGAGPGVAADPSAGFRRTERLRGKEFESVVTEMADMVSHMPGPNGAKARNAFISMAQKQGGALMARQSAALSKRAGPVAAAWRNCLSIAHAVGAGRQVLARGRRVKNVDVPAARALCGNFRLRAFPQPGSAGGNRRYHSALAAGQ